MIPLAPLAILAFPLSFFSFCILAYHNHTHFVITFGCSERLLQNEDPD